MRYYKEIDDDIQAKFNDNRSDYRAIGGISTGALLLIENKVLMLLSVEVYSRNTLLDIHSENSNDSYPEPLEKTARTYNHVKITKLEVSEGGQSVKKIVIGTKTFNILLTSTFLLTPRADKVTTVGPSMNEALHSCNFNNARILLKEEKIHSFMEYEIKQIDMSNYRQLNLEMDHASSYYPYRKKRVKVSRKKEVNIIEFLQEQKGLSKFTQSLSGNSGVTSELFTNINVD
ncbi:hypothetical protein K501DRAFT_301944 [Backusella circina FSU 941]|nr:hypothetical protein K501DRAFT_301944 [Backusella circina FSU 941]